jgi:hypothetical protein
VLGVFGFWFEEETLVPHFIKGLGHVKECYSTYLFFFLENMRFYLLSERLDVWCCDLYGSRIDCLEFLIISIIGIYVLR